LDAVVLHVLKSKLKERQIMSELTTGQGGFPPNWGVPSSLYNYKTQSEESGGYIWCGDNPDTRADDIAALQEYSDPYDPPIDVPTLFGLPCYADRRRDLPQYNQVVTLG